jgi:sec-independent protein translocase protein TatC
MFSFGKKQQQNIDPEGQMELVEHLAELRTRIFRAVAYIAVAMALTYSLVPRVLHILFRPVDQVLKQSGGLTTLNGVMESFFTYLQICFISGLILALPFVILEIWGFVAPALTTDEKKPIKYLAPFSVLLFFAGVGIGYVCLPITFKFMSSYADEMGIHITILQDVRMYMLLTVKILLAFGLMFQLPLVLLFLARVGIMTAEWMIKYWRHAVVVIAIFSAILTPTPDPLTMMMMGVPLAGLYVLSISLVRAFEPKPDGTRTPSMGTMVAAALTPLCMIGAVAFWLVRGADAAGMNPTSPTAIPTPVASPPAGAPQGDAPAALRIEIEKLKQENHGLKQRLDALEAKLK